MKTLKNTLSFFCLLIALNSSAQPFLIDNAEWRYTQVFFTDPIVDFTKVQVIGDSTILQKECKMLFRSDATCDLRSDMDFIYEEDDKVFYYDEYDEDFKMLYDYSAEVGDTLTIHFWDGNDDFPVFQDSVFYIRIDSIDQIDFGGKILKRFYTTYDTWDHSDITFYENDQHVIIEGIGSLTNYFHVFDTGWCDASYNIELRCFSHPDYGLIKFVDYPCDSTWIISSTEDYELAENELVVKPNPFVDNFSIQSSVNLPNAKYRIYDLMGQVMGQDAISIIAGQDLQISTINLPANIYLLVLFNEVGQQVSTKRIVKF